MSELKLWELRLLSSVPPPGGGAHRSPQGHHGSSPDRRERRGSATPVRAVKVPKGLRARAALLFQSEPGVFLNKK